VRRGSAVFQCVARRPEEATDNLRIVSSLLNNPDSIAQDLCDRLAASLQPIEHLSGIARRLGCQLIVSLANAGEELLAIVSDSYEAVSKRVFVTGESTVIGTVERVGGATGVRCLMRIPTRQKLLYCDVERDVVRRLGQHLYETIAAIGTATWLHHNWRVHSFRIHDFYQPKLAPVDAMIQSLRDAGLDAWDNIPDPKAYLERLGM